MLEAVFGDSAVRALAAQARHDLLERVEALLAAEARAVPRAGGRRARRSRRPRPRPAGGARRTLSGPARASAAVSRPRRAAGSAGRVDAARCPAAGRSSRLSVAAARWPGRGEPARPARALAERLAALDEVVELGRGRLTEPVVADAARIAGKAGARLRLGAAHTVVALAGATGSGKSSLFNALAGEDVSAVGVRRPTTVAAHRGGLGRRTAPGRCSTGWRCRAGTLGPRGRSRPRTAPRRPTGWCCSTCPTSTRSRSRTGWRSTGWSSWSTCWSGCSTRRSTPTPRCTTATCARWPGTPT